MDLEKVQRKLEYQLRRVYAGAQPMIYGAVYYYVLGFTKEKGRKVFWGPMSEEDAYRCLGELQDGEIFKLKTRDPRRAVREVRDLLIKRGVSPDEALRKLLHKREDATSEAPVKEESRNPLSLFFGRLHTGPARITRAVPPPKSILRRVI
ncbi:MAG: hypothetical protein QW212_00755 [Nitrososphaerales archaeon]